jgi:hypothetical protein
MKKGRRIYFRQGLVCDQFSNWLLPVQFHKKQFALLVCFEKLGVDWKVEGSI